MSGTMDNAIDENINAILGGEDANASTQDQPASSTETQPSEAFESAEAEPAKPGVKPSIGNAANAEPDKVRAKPSAVRSGTLPANDKGDLIDPNTKQVIAAAGKERAYYEAARNSINEGNRLKTDLQKLTAQVSAYEKASSIASELSLAPNESVVAMQFMAKYKADPLAAAKELLTDVLSRGYTIDELGGSSIDMAAMARMMDERLKPFTNEREQVSREHESNQAVQQEWNRTSEQFPWIAAQDEELGAVLRADPSMSLREAALSLQAYAYKNGFDLESSIIAQRDSVRAQPAQTVAPQQNRARMTVPSSGSDVPVMPKATKDAGANPSSKSIIQQSLREAGFRLER